MYGGAIEWKAVEDARRRRTRGGWPGSWTAGTGGTVSCGVGMEEKIVEAHDKALVTVGVPRSALLLNSPAKVDVQGLVNKRRSCSDGVALLPSLPEQSSETNHVAAMEVAARIAAAGVLG